MDARPTISRHAHRPHMRVVMSAIALTLLSGCSPQQETLQEDVAGAGPPPADTVTQNQWTHEAVGTQETDRTLVALGNEPFWNVRITWREILYTDPEHLDGYRFEPADAAREGDVMIYRTKRDIAAGEPGPRDLELRVSPGQCSDGMSDKQYPMTAELTIGDVQHRGCAEYRTDAQVSER